MLSYYFLALVMLLVFYGPDTRADVVNGGFETGNLTGWQSIGYVTVEMEGSIGIDPPNGYFEALVWSHDRANTITPLGKVEDALALPKGTIERLSITPVVGGSAMQQVFRASAGDVLSFEWAFAVYRDADDPTPPSYFAFVVVKQLAQEGQWLRAARLADTQSAAPEIAIGYFTNATPFSIFSCRIPRTGSYSLSLGVMDAGDNQLSAALLLDDVALSTSSVPKAP